MPGWNPWHGCHKISPGCSNCYVYRMDAKYDRISSDVVKTASFDLPVRKDRHGEYKIRSGESVGVCFTSDFFVEEADEWRKDAWSFMRERSDLHFFFITKRIARFNVSLPDDWGDGYDNVAIGCTVENMNMARECAALIRMFRRLISIRVKKAKNGGYNIIRSLCLAKILLKIFCNQLP